MRPGGRQRRHGRRLVRGPRRGGGGARLGTAGLLGPARAAVGRPADHRRRRNHARGGRGRRPTWLPTGPERRASRPTLEVEGRQRDRLAERLDQATIRASQVAARSRRGQARYGGRRPGHLGHGRSCVTRPIAGVCRRRPDRVPGLPGGRRGRRLWSAGRPTRPPWPGPSRTPCSSLRHVRRQLDLTRSPAGRRAAGRRRRPGRSGRRWPGRGPRRCRPAGDAQPGPGRYGRAGRGPAGAASAARSSARIQARPIAKPIADDRGRLGPGGRRGAGRHAARPRRRARTPAPTRHRAAAATPAPVRRPPRPRQPSLRHPTRHRRPRRPRGQPARRGAGRPRSPPPNRNWASPISGGRPAPTALTARA